MGKRKQAEASWAACKRAMSDWPRPGVVALVQELYKLSDDNRRFLHARLLDHLAGANLEDARRKIKMLVCSSAVYGNRFRHAEVKRVIDAYAKASGDPAAVAELLIGDIDASCATFDEVGDFEPIVDHAYASMRRLHKTFEQVEPMAAKPLVEAISLVAARWSGSFGYGLSDELDGLAAEWRDRLGVAEMPGDGSG